MRGGWKYSGKLGDTDSSFALHSSTGFICIDRYWLSLWPSLGGAGQEGGIGGLTFTLNEHLTGLPGLLDQPRVCTHTKPDILHHQYAHGLKSWAYVEGDETSRALSRSQLSHVMSALLR